MEVHCGLFRSVLSAFFQSRSPSRREAPNEVWNDTETTVFLKLRARLRTRVAPR